MEATLSQTEFNVFISAFLINRLILLFHDSSILQMMPLLLAMIDDALTYQYSPQPHNLSLLLLHSYNVCFKKKKKKTTSHWLHYMIMTMQVLFTDKTTKLWMYFSIPVSPFFFLELMIAKLIYSPFTKSLSFFPNVEHFSSHLLLPFIYSSTLFLFFPPLILQIQLNSFISALAMHLSVWDVSFSLSWKLVFPVSFNELPFSWILSLSFC